MARRQKKSMEQAKISIKRLKLYINKRPEINKTKLGGFLKKQKKTEQTADCP